MAATALAVATVRESRPRGGFQRWAGDGAGSIATGAHPEFRLALNDTLAGAASKVSNLYWAITECEVLIQPGDADDADEVQVMKLELASGDWEPESRGTRQLRYLDAVRIQSNVSGVSFGVYRLAWPIYCGRPKAGGRGRVLFHPLDTGGFVSSASSSVTLRVGGIVHDRPFGLDRMVL